jgi:Ser/Thr protein kinase RdoA (MazF antagonist)
LRQADLGSKIACDGTMSERSLESVPEAVADRYGVDLPPPWEPVAGGASDALFRAGDFAVRLERADPESVRWEHALLRFLAEEIEEVIEPLVALDGSTFSVDRGRVVSVFPFLDGDELRSHEALFRHELPVLLARVHRRAQEWPVTDQRPGVPSVRERDWDRNDWWDWGAVEKAPPLVRAFEELREWVATADLCVSAIHGDFHSGNVLVRDGRIAGIVDWQYARRDWPALELAGVVWDLCWDGKSTSLDPVLRNEVAREYVDAGGPGEPGAIVPLMRLESLVSALISLTRAAQSRPWDPEFTRLLVATLDELA